MKQFDETKAKTWSIRVVDSDGGCLSMIGTCSESTPAKITVEHGWPEDEFLTSRRLSPKPPPPKTLVATLPDPTFTMYPQSSDTPTVLVELAMDQLIQFTTCLNPSGPNRCRECVSCELNEAIHRALVCARSW